MNICFCGYGSLGKSTLERLMQEGYHIRYILTHPDMSGDGVDTYAKENQITFSYQDSRKHSKEVASVLNDEQINVLISVNYRFIIPKEVFSIPRYAFNIHGSLLPKYRGRTPHVWSIIHGELSSGITSHLIEETVDTGDIIKQIEVPIDEKDTGYTLLKKYEHLYPQLAVDSLQHLNDEKPLIAQNEKEASFFGKRTPDMGYIDFHKEGHEVINFIRAQADPYPGAYYYLVSGQKITIHQVEKHHENDTSIPIGVINEIGGRLVVRCKDCMLEIKNYSIV